MIKLALQQQPHFQQPNEAYKERAAPADPGRDGLGRPSARRGARLCRRGARGRLPSEARRGAWLARARAGSRQGRTARDARRMERDACQISANVQ